MKSPTDIIIVISNIHNLPIWQLHICRCTTAILNELLCILEESLVNMHQLISHLLWHTQNSCMDCLVLNVINSVCHCHLCSRMLHTYSVLSCIKNLFSLNSDMIWRFMGLGISEEISSLLGKATCVYLMIVCGARFTNICLWTSVWTVICLWVYAFRACQFFLLLSLTND